MIKDPTIKIITLIHTKSFHLLVIQIGYLINYVRHYYKNGNFLILP